MFTTYTINVPSGRSALTSKWQAETKVSDMKVHGKNENEVFVTFDLTLS